MAVNHKNLPHNTEAEKAVLGAMLKSSSILGDCVGKLSEEDFFPENKNHVVIFQAMQRCFKRGTAVDIQTVVDELINAYVKIIAKVKSSSKEVAHFDSRIHSSHVLEVKLTKVTAVLIYRHVL